MALTREQILSSRIVETTPVDVPEWGGQVFVRVMTGAERDSFQASLYKGETFDGFGLAAKMIVRCVCNEQGQRLFTDEDWTKLQDTSCLALDRVLPIAQKINRQAKDDTEALVKN